MNLGNVHTTATRVSEELRSYQLRYPESAVASLTSQQVGIVAHIAARVIVSDSENLFPLIAAALPYNLSRQIGMEANEDKRRERAVDDAIRDAMLTLLKISGLREHAGSDLASRGEDEPNDTTKGRPK